LGQGTRATVPLDRGPVRCDACALFQRYCPMHIFLRPLTGSIAQFPLFALLLSLLLAGPALATCDITLRLQNETGIRVRVLRAEIEARSSVAPAPAPAVWGSWRRVGDGGWGLARYHDLTYQDFTVHIRGFVESTYRAVANCPARRQFRVTYECESGPNAGRRYTTQIGPGSGISDRGRRAVLPVAGRC
jgi:hypothetical protein